MPLPKKSARPFHSWPAEARGKDLGPWFNLGIRQACQPLILAPLARGRGWAPDEIRALSENIRGDAYSNTAHAYCTLNLVLLGFSLIEGVLLRENALDILVIVLDSRKRNQTNGGPESIILGDDEADRDQPAPSYTSVLQFPGSTFTIYRENLLSLHPGQWLEGKVINGTLRLLKEVSNDSVQVVDSGDERVTGVDFHKSKVLLPMLIRGNHWVLGVYKDSTGLLVYDSLPSSITKSTLLNKARSLLPKLFQMDDKTNPEITITSPLLQTNADDCGVFSIIAAFHETMGFGITPTEIDPDFWRDILLRLLSPQPYVEQVPVKTQIDLSVLPNNLRQPT
ncbi:hypothetical protein F5144DRAFT_545201 [Chaetomium tenue]|uniref:Uncharacterized protein n=1 Tax=Chaetomium tenue TaxID=1854479 RepID=A0ACB7PJD0_9PEZI|nr:hypothetical protein F5144DRAFT_545201 [Chaetomium globosum]